MHRYVKWYIMKLLILLQWGGIFIVVVWGCFQWTHSSHVGITAVCKRLSLNWIKWLFFIFFIKYYWCWYSFIGIIRLCNRDPFVLYQWLLEVVITNNKLLLAYIRFSHRVYMCLTKLFCFACISCTFCICIACISYIIRACYFWCIS